MYCEIIAHGRDATDETRCKYFFLDIISGEVAQLAGASEDFRH